MFNKFNLIPLEDRIVLDAAVAAVIYVDVHSTGSNNGSSWANAYTDLQTALNAAASTAGADQIWIADGVYKPSQIYSPNNITGGASGLNDAHLMTFNLPDNVSLYGGFKGNEKHLQQRNPDKNITTLSGDKLGNDLLDRNAPGYAASKADNVWHVITAGNDITQTGVTVLMDGIRVTGGYAAGPVDPALAYIHDSGGGLYARWGSNITINEMTYIRNNATEDAAIPDNTFIVGGGGIFAMDDGTLLTVKHSSFISNVANGKPDVEHAGFGGGINMAGGATLHLYNSEFQDNSAWRAGGGIRIRNSVDNIIVNSDFHDNFVSRPDFFAVSGGALSLQGSIVDVIGSDFIHNNANSANFTGGGGAIFLDSVFGRLSIVNINDCYFKDNSASIFGGGAIFALGTVANPDSFLTINDSTFIGNESSNGGAVYFNSFNTEINDSTFKANHSRLFGGAVTYSNFFDNFFGLPTTKQLTINDSVFSKNTVEPLQVEMDFHELIFNIFGFNLDPATIGGGAAIVNHENGNMVINGSIFDKNLAINSAGGAILNGGVLAQPLDQPSLNILYNDSITINGSKFTDNKAVDGGAIAAISVAPVGSPGGNVITLDNSIFKKNSASDDGGAVYLDRTTATLTGNVFQQNNEAGDQGDKVFGSDSTINGVLSSNSTAAINILKNTNTFRNLDNNDIFMI